MTTKTTTRRKPRKLVTLNENKKDSFAIGVSADNYHFITKLAEAKGSNRAYMLDQIIDKYASEMLSKAAV